MAATLSGCVKTNYSCIKGNDLPDVPTAGLDVAKELETLCQNKDCTHINQWLNELYFFRQEYVIYKNYEINQWNI